MLYHATKWLLCIQNAVFSPGQNRDRRMKDSKND